MEREIPPLRAAIFLLVALVTLLVIPSTLHSRLLERPLPAKQWTRHARLLTAQSCVGEASFQAVEECIAIAWVYATRAREVKKPYIWIVPRYSAALKDHDRHRRPWIKELNTRGDKPPSWPGVLRWKKAHREYWLYLLASLDAWAEGRRRNPCPGANHFGSHDDTQQFSKLQKSTWRVVKAPKHFMNTFLNSNARVRPVKPRKIKAPIYNPQTWRNSIWIRRENPYM